MSRSPDNQEENGGAREGCGSARQKGCRSPARKAPAEKHPVVGYLPSAGGEKGKPTAGPFRRLLQVLGVERTSRFKSG